MGKKKRVVRVVCIPWGLGVLRAAARKDGQICCTHILIGSFTSGRPIDCVMFFETFFALIVLVVWMMK